jgi:hypothetical protein
MNSPQTVNLNLVFDYELQSGDPTRTTARAIVGQVVYATLMTDADINAAPIVNLAPTTIESLPTDANGYWQMYLSTAPAGSYWLLTTPTRQIRITGAAGQASQHLAS